KFFDQEMQRAGNRCEFKLYDGQVHGFFNYGKSNNRYFEQTLTEADRFLESLGYLEGEPQVAAWLRSRERADQPGKRR
ncbi:MAG: hypothetical protein KDA75_16600, partial [Planctomycetaceae bacterium]|nr:hypothetical protein [Planctomycetaceae bacterium]